MLGGEEPSSWRVRHFETHHMTISAFRKDPRFAACPQALVVTGKPEHDAHNRRLLAKSQTGYWVIADGRVRPGDLIFLILPNKDARLGYPRELYAGVVVKARTMPNDGHLLLTVHEFFFLKSIAGDIKEFLDGKVPPQGNRANQVWALSSDSAANFNQAFDSAVENSIRDEATARQRRLATAPAFPTRVTATTSVFVRNPDVVAEVLHRANGICARCKEPAPFKRRHSLQPYLEVHHKMQLAAGGEDTVANAIALCPNCHREEHFGASSA